MIVHPRLVLNSSKDISELSFIDRFMLFMYSLYFILTPFYLWRSGLPQIADFVMLFLILFYLSKKRLKLNFASRVSKFVISLLVFIYYISVVNLVWLLKLHGTGGFLQTNLFYIYNAIITLFVLSLYSDYKDILLKITYKSVIISVFIQLFFLLVQGGYSGGRMTLFFNNPNQLGYYGLLSASLLLFLSNYLEVKTNWFFLGIIVAGIMTIISLSSTAIAAFLMLVGTFFFVTSKNKKIKVRLLILFLILGSSILILNYTTTIFQENRLISGLMNRIVVTETKIDNFVYERGYYRITQYPQYWIFGAGEGDYSRFQRSYEFHSTVGNIQVSYGFIGLILFLWFLFLAVRNTMWPNTTIVLSIFAYGLTHNGIRNSLLWVLLALMATTDYSQLIEQKTKSRI